ncbi:elongation factor G [Janibacter sp. YIM B02568]|uniref:elongation factor G n=1 Tax=Janibacter endophyticus TaxID=2806261 RepID=UPI00194F839B|nr:elongation factor G [Janibacter endophyticus]MBM6546317.1 elongation factor G [Janibacter endophyticus]
MAVQQRKSHQVPVVEGAHQLRNVALVGPSGSGKSRLFEVLTGVRTRADQVDRSSALVAATAALPGTDLALTLLDTPGHPDFVGEVRAALRAADSALFVVSAADGVDASTRALWHECALTRTPRAVVVVQLDAESADYAATLAECQAVFGQGVQPLGIPVAGEGGALTQVVDLVLGEVHDYSRPEREVRPAREEHAVLFETYRSALIEGIIEESEDETLMERYLGGEEVDFETIEHALLTAVGRGSFFPVVPASAETGSGLHVVRHLVAAGLPSPESRPLPVATGTSGGSPRELTCSPDGPLAVEVVHTRSDPYVGHVSLVRVFSGTLLPSSAVHVSGHLDRLDPGQAMTRAGHDDDVRVGTVGLPRGDEVVEVERAVAGQVVVVTRLATAATTDTISSPEDPLLIEPWALPDALLPVALEPVTRADEDKLGTALREIAAEDSALRVERDPRTEQDVLWTTGVAHQDLVLARLKDRFGVDVRTAPVKVGLRETFVAPAAAQGRHVKQSGGHGQFAVCHLEVAPGEPGSGIVFTERVVGGAVPRGYIPSVEKGARAQLASGLLAGWPVVDVVVTLTDGKAHSVDSSDQAFQTAAGLALRELASAEVMTLLEPVDEVQIVVDSEHVGAVLTDLGGRRAQILGTDAEDDEGLRTRVDALVPQLELVDYPIALRSVAHGTAELRRSPHGYEPMPERLAAEHAGSG